MTRAPRAGKSLIELMVVLVAASAVFGMIGQMLHRLGRVERANGGAAAVARTTLRLAEGFRADVRSASAAEPSADASHLTLTTADGPIVYSAESNGVRRKSPRNGGEAVEFYRLGPAVVTFSRDGDRSASLTVGAPAKLDSPVDPPPVAGPVRIVAAVGADRLRITDSREPAAGVPVEAPRPTNLEGGTP